MVVNADLFKTEPWVYADLLFGIRNPGMIAKEIAETATDAEQWKDLAGDKVLAHGRTHARLP